VPVTVPEWRRNHRQVQAAGPAIAPPAGGENVAPHLDEMGDLCRKLLIVELMGKYSNIIFCSPDGTILDSIKHISVQVSSVREVLPGRQYFSRRRSRSRIR